MNIFLKKNFLLNKDFYFLLFFLVSITLILFIFSTRYESTDGLRLFLTAASLNDFSIQAYSNILPMHEFLTNPVNGNTYNKGPIGYAFFIFPFYTFFSLFFSGENSEVLRHLVPKFANAFYLSLILFYIYKICSFYRIGIRNSYLCVIFITFSTPLIFYSGSDLSEIVQALLILCIYYYFFYCRKFALAFILLFSLVLVKPIYILIFPILLCFIFNNLLNMNENSKVYLLNLIYGVLLAVLSVATILFINYIKTNNFLNFGDGVAFDNPVHYGVYSLLFSFGKGLFFYAPLMIVSFFFLFRDIIKNPKNEMHFIFILIVFIVFLIMYSKYHFWHGDWAWGPRYLVPFLPLLSIPMVKYFAQLKKITIYSLFVFGFIVNSSSIYINPCNYLSLYFIQIKDTKSFDEQIQFHKHNRIYYDFHASPVIILPLLSINKVISKKLNSRPLNYDYLDSNFINIDTTTYGNNSFYKKLKKSFRIKVLLLLFLSVFGLFFISRKNRLSDDK